MTEQQSPRLFLIDGSSYIYRAYYAIRQLSKSRGQATNAVFGFNQVLGLELGYGFADSTTTQTKTINKLFFRWDTLAWKDFAFQYLVAQDDQQLPVLRDGACNDFTWFSVHGMLLIEY